jgi:hypothetical protein
MGASLEEDPDRQLDVRDGVEGNRGVAVQPSGLAIPATGRDTVHLEDLVVEVHQPGFGDPGPGVERQLHLPVELDRGIRDLDDEAGVARLRVPDPVATAGGTKDGQVRLPRRTGP